ncbi:MAG: hypothetical protein M3M88_03760 [Thermoproteota archaeon]|nr:hypothetical protein [Thermoproteota archaeon]
MNYFEIDRVIEELPKSFAAPSATTWFKVSGQTRPSIKEYRDKVIELMNNFKSTLFESYPKNDRSAEFIKYTKKEFEKAISEVNRGNNKEVEKRFRYFTEYS